MKGGGGTAKRGSHQRRVFRRSGKGPEFFLDPKVGGGREKGNI